MCAAPSGVLRRPGHSDTHSQDILYMANSACTDEVMHQNGFATELCSRDLDARWHQRVHLPALRGIHHARLKCSQIRIHLLPCVDYLNNHKAQSSYAQTMLHVHERLAESGHKTSIEEPNYAMRVKAW